MQQSFCLFSVVGFHLAQEDAVIVESLAGVLAELLEQVVHGHLAAGLTLDIEDDAARVHHEGAVAQLQCLMHIVGDHQAGDLLFGHDALGEVQHLFGGGRVESGGVLVQKQTRLLINYSEYEKDASLKGEFIRMVLGSDMTEEQKSEVIRCGISALSGEEI